MNRKILNLITDVNAIIERNVVFMYGPPQEYYDTMRFLMVTVISVIVLTITGLIVLVTKWVKKKKAKGSEKEIEDNKEKNE